MSQLTEVRPGDIVFNWQGDILGMVLQHCYVVLEPKNESGAVCKTLHTIRFWEFGGNINGIKTSPEIHQRDMCFYKNSKVVRGAETIWIG